MLIWSDKINSYAQIRFYLTTDFKNVIHLLDARRAFHQTPTLLWSVSCVSLVFKTRRAKRGTFHWRVGVKRFTETTKWDDPWFMDLPIKYKLFWLYLCDRCDNAGAWEPNMRLVAAHIGEPFELIEVLRVFAGRISQLECGKLFITKFIPFQYGNLSPNCRAHIPILNAVEKLRVSKGYPKGIHTLMEKDMDMEKDSVQIGGDWSAAVKLLSKTTLKRFEEWIAVRKAMGKKPRNWEKMFIEQIKWLSQYSEPLQIEIISASIRNNWQGLFEPKSANGKQPTFKPAYKRNYLPPANELTEAELAAQRKIVREASEKLKAEFNR